MSLPMPIEPESNEPARDESSRADWLVGAEEGIEAELSRRERLSRAIPAPKLFRPGTDAAAEPQAPAPPPPAPIPLSRPALPTQVAPSASTPTAPKSAPSRAPLPDDDDGGFVRGNAMTWEPAPSSVPNLRREPTRRAPLEVPERDFPMDDAEERAKARAEAQMVAIHAANGVPQQPHAVVAPEAFDLAIAPLPWYMQIPAQIRTDKRLWVLIGLGVAVLLTIALWPRGPQPESLGNLNKHPDRYDGHIVTVAGKVGDVFEVGGGHAYYLLQGRDTLVVFTRTEAPRRMQHVQLSGTVSTGYLDGEPHLALFEIGKD